MTRREVAVMNLASLRAKARERQLSLWEMRLLLQSEQTIRRREPQLSLNLSGRRSTVGVYDCCLVTPETASEHGHAPLPSLRRDAAQWRDDEPGIPGACDAKALAALRARAMKPIDRMTD